MTTAKPDYLSQCNPNARLFPKDWKETYFRLSLDPIKNAYLCPNCSSEFRGPRGFAQLRADHKHPFSRGGPTIWENLQLLCAPCNEEKSAKILIIL